MKAAPVKLVMGEGYKPTTIEEATHVRLNFPGPVGVIVLPVILKGSRDVTKCWTWNGDTEKPTLRPSVLTQGTDSRDGPSYGQDYRCHTWVNNGQAQFLDDCTHELRGQTVDMLNAAERSQP